MLRRTSPLLGVSALLLTVIAAPAVAQPKPSTPAPAPAPAPVATAELGLTGPKGEPSAGDLAKARAIFDAGGRAYDAGNYTAALQAFEQAYAIAGRDNIVFSIAQAHRQAFVMTQDGEQLGKAIAAYKQFILSGKAGARKGEAVKALGELEAIAATRSPTSTQGPTPTPATQKTMLSVNSPTPGAMISIDGSEPAPPQVDADVTPGPHKVKVTAPGYVDKDVTVELKPGEFAPETFELEEKPAKLSIAVPSGASVSIDGRFVAQAPITRALDVAPGRRFVSVTLAGHQSKGETLLLSHGEEKKFGPHLSTTAQRDTSFAVFAIAGGGAVATGVLAGLAVAKQNAAENIGNLRKTRTITDAERQTYTDSIASRDTFRTAAIGTGAGGAVLAAIGLTLFAADHPSSIEPPPEIGPMQPTDERPKPAAPKVEMQLAPWFSPETSGIGVRGSF